MDSRLTVFQITLLTNGHCARRPRQTRVRHTQGRPLFQLQVLHQSPYRTVCGSQTRIVELEDIEIIFSKVFVAWLYTGTLTYAASRDGCSAQQELKELNIALAGGWSCDKHPLVEDEEPPDDLTNFNENAPETWAHLILVGLYILGDRFDAPKFKTLVIQAIIKKEEKTTPPNEAVLYAYAHTSRDSPLRRLLVYIWTYEIRYDRPSYTFEGLPVEFLAAVMVTAGRRLPSQQCKSCFDSALDGNYIQSKAIDDVCHDVDEPPYMRDPCFYHEHKDEDEKQACRAERKESGN